MEIILDEKIVNDLQHHKAVTFSFNGEEFTIISKKAQKLDKLYIEALEDINKGNYKNVSAEEHLRDLINEIQNQTD